ncbi:MAG TPA: choice-of-anchor Q domain-containing protein [Burkholderiales bacterium]|nr:choice-of-anchor Q domain-containing protein [Burkholderiales bacterium]
MSLRFSRALTLAALLLLPLFAGAAPRIFYTDIINGPNTGGLNNLGAFLTIFGAGFGATQGTSAVTINNTAVGAVIQWSDAKITVQPGPAVTSGAIKVSVGGVGSNTDQTFTVVPGKIYFVSNGTGTAPIGSDSTGVAGDITKPFRNIQNVFDNSLFVPGDHIVVRGGTWSDIYPRIGSFFAIVDKGGTATAPFVIMGYPTETATFLRTNQTHGFHSFNTTGHYVISNLVLDANGAGVTISLEQGSTDIRIVNNEVKNMLENGGGAAAIEGSGSQYRILGNHVHDNGGSKLYHALYFDGRASTAPTDIEIAYNNIHHQSGGRGIQIFSDTLRVITNVRVHNNLVHDISLDGIHFADNTGAGFQAYNNVVYNTASAALRGPFTDTGTDGGCIRFVSTVLVALVYNNTFSNCNLDGDVDSGGIRFQNALSITLINNIVNGKYFVNIGSLPATLVAPNNLWFGGGTPPTFATVSQTGDPKFVSAATGNFHLLAGSAAIDNGSAAVNALVTTDFDGNPRPQGTAPDIGAFESSGVTLPTPANLKVILLP